MIDYTKAARVQRGLALGYLGLAIALSLTATAYALGSEWWLAGTSAVLTVCVAGLAGLGFRAAQLYAKIGRLDEELRRLLSD